MNPTRQKCMEDPEYRAAIEATDAAVIRATDVLTAHYTRHPFLPDQGKRAEWLAKVERGEVPVSVLADAMWALEQAASDFLHMQFPDLDGSGTRPYHPRDPLSPELAGAKAALRHRLSPVLARLELLCGASRRLESAAEEREGDMDKWIEIVTRHQERVVPQGDK